MFTLVLTPRQQERLPALLAALLAARQQQLQGHVTDVQFEFQNVLQQLRNMLAQAVRYQVLVPSPTQGALLVPLFETGSSNRPQWAGFPIAGLAIDCLGHVYLATVGDHSDQKPFGTVTLLVNVAYLGLPELPLLVNLVKLLQAGGFEANKAHQREQFNQAKEDLQEVEELAYAPSSREEKLLGRYGD